MKPDPELAEVKAAGAVVFRSDSDGGREVVLVHRPKYDDWSLPKGKLDPRESWETAALREVHEETGQRGKLGRELDPVFYADRKGRRKAVRYWLIEADPEQSESFTADHEVDQILWVTPAEAEAKLTYALDHRVLAQAVRELGR